MMTLKMRFYFTHFIYQSLIHYSAARHSKQEHVLARIPADISVAERFQETQIKSGAVQIAEAKRRRAPWARGAAVCGGALLLLQRCVKKRTAHWERSAVYTHTKRTVQTRHHTAAFSTHTLGSQYNFTFTKLESLPYFSSSNCC